MSSTNRKSERDPFDYYPTQPWMVERLLEKLPLEFPLGGWWEPCAGDGAIIRAVNECTDHSVRWFAHEIQPMFRSSLCETGAHVTIGDALTHRPVLNPSRYHVTITNPKFSIAVDVVKRAMMFSNHVITLQRLNWLGSDERSTWLRSNTPDVYVLPERCAFDERGADSVEYAWFHWVTHRRLREGKIVILDSTPKPTRQKERAEAIARMHSFGVFREKRSRSPRTKQRAEVDGASREPNPV